MAKEDFKLDTACGVALLEADEFRKVRLDFEADDKPLRHADVVGWPWGEDDREFGKAVRIPQTPAALEEAAKHPAAAVGKVPNAPVFQIAAAHECIHPCEDFADAGGPGSRSRPRA